MEVTGPGSVPSSFPIKSIQKAAESSKTTSVQPTSPSDELEISSVGKKLDALNQMPDVRAERLVQIKSAIEAGEYETAERLEAAVDRLLDQIQDEKQHG